MRNLQVLSRLACRTISTTARRSEVAMGQSATKARGVVPNTPGYKTLMRRQQEWTKDDGKMVWQKRGFVDLVQVRGLEILAGVAGVAICAHFLMMIFPKRD
ncbi:hypothetical protein NP493_437g01001 [Ridgeia piscesae]|uniref:Uncharacterized protein n=1 Tax=Ridgeia piscesae TaxID=27915 RepID=A0AAD9L0Z8_RIDPI|nr:hypothetical protein NP493_437g01001 [Ridgeia piscesae]